MTSDLSPDHVEERLAAPLDQVVPARADQLLPLIGLGGSAGSIPALQTFFRTMPPDSGMAFVIVIHLSSTHESALAELIQRTTAMRVVQVRETEQIRPDCVYVIPPGKSLAALDGELRLDDLPANGGRHVVVDLFFRTLADAYGPRGTAIVLSGADGDGAIGIRRVKERGGLSIAQDPLEAEHGGMPRAAIATGVVDLVLPVGAMAARLISYHRLERQLRLPPESARAPAPVPVQDEDVDEAALIQVLHLMKTRTGHDVAAYRRATVLRRIARRMQVNEVLTLPDYLEVLRTRAGESRALLKDLFVSVTNFFRDAKHFEALSAQIPALFDGKAPTETVRVWVPGCATGEEAYSIAILLHEAASRLECPPRLRVFASDLDADAIQVGRTGFYPSTIAADVSPERLGRFFSAALHGYRICAELRETVLFATHDVLTDSPFSRVDLVSCRNLLIYLTRDAQVRALDIFHFSLRPEGKLFLGSSESVDESTPLFAVIDKKNRLFSQRPAARAKMPILPGPTTLSLTLAELPKGGRLPGVRPVIPSTVPLQVLQPFEVSTEARAASWAHLHYRLLEQIAPPSILIDGEHNIVHLSESAGRFLQLSGGEPTKNLLRLIDPALRIELRAALFQAQQSDTSLEFGPATIELNGEQTRVKVANGCSSQRVMRTT